MNLKENIISLNSRRKSGKSKPMVPKGRPAEVVDLTERRDEILQEERRKVRRTILSEFIGVHVVVPNRGLLAVTLFDVSADGLSFDVPAAAGRFRVGDEIAMRVYLNQKTYFSFVIKVSNVRVLGEEGSIRHGAAFVKNTVNEVALSHFVRFIETVSANLETDAGDVTVGRLGRHR